MYKDVSSDGSKFLKSDLNFWFSEILKENYETLKKCFFIKYFYKI